jgi:hypothetical protein
VTSSRPSARFTAVALFLFTLGLLAFARLGAEESELTHDGAHYLEIARHVARGEGYTTQTHWALNLDRPLDDDGVRFPDTYRAPLFPLLVAGASAVTGDLFGSARWIIVLFGACIPPLVYLLARHVVRLPAGYAVFAGVLAAVHHHLVMSGTRPLTETPYTLGVLATVYLVLTGRPRVGGIAAGLTWLLRTQGLLLIPIALLALVWRNRAGGFGRQSAWFLGLLAVTIAPWVVRTVAVTGQPFYSDLKYHILSSYDPDIVDFEYDVTTYEYFRGLAPAPEPVSYLLSHPSDTIAHVVGGLNRLVRVGARENAGNLLLAFLAVVGGIGFLIARPSELRADPPRRFFLAVMALSVLNIGVVSLAFVDARHLTSLDPFLVLFSAVGLWWIGSWVSARAKRVGTAAVVSLAVCGIAWECVTAYRQLTAFIPRAFPEAAFAEGVIDPDSTGAVMAQKPYFFSYLLDRPAVSLPWCDDDDFLALVEKHDVRYVSIADAVRTNHAYPGSFMERGVDPAWLRPIGRHDGPGSATLYEVVREGIEPTPAAR